jgi:serine/threonine protein kinase
MSDAKPDHEQTTRVDTDAPDHDPVFNADRLIEEKLSHRFQLEGQIGAGGMGQVFKARDLKLQRTVAIKVIHPRLIATEGVSERLENEARIVARLKHPNIVQIHDFIEESGHYLMILEFIEGHDLKQVIDQGLLERSKVLAKFIDVCDAVQYAHRQGIIHRDLKPHNIMITRDGDIKIMDFGISTLVEDHAQEDDRSPGSLEGSPVFMAPELYENKDASTSTDVFALGVSLFYAQTSQLPFAGMPRETLIWNILNTDIPAPSSKKSDISPEIDAICIKACSRDPDGRYQSAHQMGDDLRRLVQSLPVSARKYPLLESVVRAIRFRPVATVISLLMISVLFLAVFFGTNHVHKVAEKTLIDTLHHKVGSIAYGASLALRIDSVKELIEAPADQMDPLFSVDQRLASLQNYSPEIRDFYLLSPQAGGRDFRIVYARHGSGELNLQKVRKGHDTWASVDALVTSDYALGLMRQTLDGKLVIQEEQDKDSTHSSDWQKRMLGYSPVYDSSGKAIAVLVVEVASGGIAVAYQQIEDAYDFSLVVAIFIVLSFIIGVGTTLVLLWRNEAPV